MHSAQNGTCISYYFQLPSQRAIDVWYKSKQWLTGFRDEVLGGAWHRAGEGLESRDTAPARVWLIGALQRKLEALGVAKVSVGVIARQHDVDVLQGWVERRVGVERGLHVPPGQRVGIDGNRAARGVTSSWVSSATLHHIERDCSRRGCRVRVEGEVVPCPAGLNAAVGVNAEAVRVAARMNRTTTYNNRHMEVDYGQMRPLTSSASSKLSQFD